MIKLQFNKHDFLYAIEGFARGSHLRQHVWEIYVFRSIPQMKQDDMDYLWFYMRRDLWECYFYEIGGKKQTHCGYEDFLHTLAALHRGNHYVVDFTSETDNKQHRSLCYRFDGHYRPIITDGSKKVDRFNSFIPDEWIIKAEHCGHKENRYVEVGKEAWWEDIEIYNNYKDKILQ